MDDTTKLTVAEIRKFNRFYTNIIGLVNQTILESPYSLAEARVLLEIDNASKCTASELTEMLQIDPGYLSRILRRFKKDGLIETKRSITDGRSQIISITEKGRETFSQLSEASSTQLIDLLAQFPRSAQKQLVNHMSEIQNMLSGQYDKAISIRECQPGDAGYIAYRHGILYAQEHKLDQLFEKYVLQSLVKYLDNPTAGKIFIAECSGNIIGFIGVVEVSKTEAQLRWFLIEPEFRGVGLGRHLLSTVIEYCTQKNYKQLFLWTFKGLDTARHLYEQFGFSLSQEKENSTWGNHLIEQRWDAVLNAKF